MKEETQRQNSGANGGSVERMVRRWLTPKARRLELRFVSYGEADKLIREGWQLAIPEEDNNHVFGWVFVERRETPNAPDQRRRAGDVGDDRGASPPFAASGGSELRL